MVQSPKNENNPGHEGAKQGGGGVGGAGGGNVSEMVRDKRIDGARERLDTLRRISARETTLMVLEGLQALLQEFGDTQDNEKRNELTADFRGLAGNHDRIANGPGELCGYYKEVTERYGLDELLKRTQDYFEASDPNPSERVMVLEILRGKIKALRKGP
jgi:hypothetical protein